MAALEPSENSAAEQFALILASTGLLYFFFVFYGIMLAQGVVEEKTSRVVELLLSTIRPWQLLAGELIGVAVVGLTQLCAARRRGGGTRPGHRRRHSADRRGRDAGDAGRLVPPGLLPSPPCWPRRPRGSPGRRTSRVWSNR